MRLSVIVTAKNNAKTIRECISRILVAPPRDKEVIVVYGMSTDGTEKIIEKFRGKVKILRDDVSPGSAINTGVLHSSGDILFYVEGHSFVSSDIFIKTLKAFREDDKLGYLIFKRYVPRHFDGNKCQKLINVWRKNSGGTMGQFRGFRKRAFFDVGGFWIYPFGADDLEFATRICGRGWRIKVLETRSWDVPRESFPSVFKYYLFKVGPSEYLWYEKYRNHPYALHEYGRKARWLKIPSLIVLYNLMLKRFFAPIYAVKIALKEKLFSFIPFYVAAQLCYILGFILASLFYRGRQKWDERCFN